MVLPVPSGTISQLNVNFVSGAPSIDMLKPRPATTSWNVTSCELPRSVVIFPVVPSAIAPSTSADAMPEFHWLQRFGSDHTRQTAAGGAVVEREAPYFFLGGPPPLFTRVRHRGANVRVRRS